MGDKDKSIGKQREREREKMEISENYGERMYERSWKKLILPLTWDDFR
jgi:hypothetical protein